MVPTCLKVSNVKKHFLLMKIETTNRTAESLDKQAAPAIQKSFPTPNAAAHKLLISPVSLILTYANMDGARSDFDESQIVVNSVGVKVFPVDRQ